jgi:O-antigen/teichoic acid export membrane protein
MPSGKPLTLRRNFSWTFAGSAIYALSQWGVVVVLTKLGNPEMVGQFTLGLAIAAPVVMFTNLQLRHIQVTDAKQQYQFADYFGLRLLSTGLAFLIISLLAWGPSRQLDIALVIWLVGVAKGIESISDICYGFMQKMERMDRVALSQMIKGPLMLVLLGIGVWLSKSVVGGVVGLILAWGGVLIFWEWQNMTFILSHLTVSSEAKSTTSLRPRLHAQKLRQLIGLSLPLGFVMMLISLNTNIPRYYIEHFLSARELGIFGAIAYLVVPGQMTLSAMAESALPRLAKYYAERNREGFKSLLFKLMMIGTAVGLAGVGVALVVGKPFLSNFYSPEYGEYTSLFLYLMIAAGINYAFAFLGYGRTAAQYFRVQVLTSFLVTVSSAIACFLLIPIYGLTGAAFALIIAAFVEAGTNFGVILHALYRIRPSAPAITS